MRPGEQGPEAEYFVGLREGVRVEFDATSVRFVTPVNAFAVRLPEGRLRDAVARLADGLVPLDKALDGLLPAERAPFQRLLGRLGRLLVWGLDVGGRELIRLEHTAQNADPGIADVPGDHLVRLSRFALCRNRSGAWVLESPLARVRVLLVHPAAGRLVASLTDTRCVGDLTKEAEDAVGVKESEEVVGAKDAEEAVEAKEAGAAANEAGMAKDAEDTVEAREVAEPEGNLTAAQVRTLIGVLADAGFVEVRAAGEDFEEDPTLRQWDFHDLLFHSRVRAGRFDEPLGGVFAHKGAIAPQPAVKPVPEGPSVELYRPSLDDLGRRDPSLTAALEGRRSFRGYGEQPLTARQIGEFLYRVGRIRTRFVPAADDEPGAEIVSRPFPTGGSAFELELYLTVQRCAGIDQGVYYYDPLGHRLVLVNADPGDRRAMLEVASVATNREARPDVLITMTSRFQRLSWKYSGMAYATTLRHTGVLYQSMYLVATAMGLAPCGIGIGDADMSARVLGLDYLRESSVGDFILGSRPPGDPGIWDQEQGWKWENDPQWAAWAASELGRS